MAIPSLPRKVRYRNLSLAINLIRDLVMTLFQRPLKIFMGLIFLTAISGAVGHFVAYKQYQKQLQLVSQAFYQKGQEEGRPFSQIEAGTTTDEIIGSADEIVNIEEIGLSGNKYYFRITVKEGGGQGREKFYADAVDIAHLSLIQRLKLLKQLLDVKKQGGPRN